MTNVELADWLDQLHSHSVYDAVILTEELPVELAALVPTQTTAQVRRAMENRGLGGDITTKDTILFTGYIAAMALSRARCGNDACQEAYGQIAGRGSIHRAAIALIRRTPDND
jgi:hypothetical protein